MQSRVNTKEIINWIESEFPAHKANLGDKIGLHFDGQNTTIEKILITLDVTIESVEKATNEKVDLIIAHHPFLYELTWEEEFLQAPYKKNIIDNLKKNNISVYIIHTNINNVLIGTPTYFANKTFWNLYTPNINNPYISFFDLKKDHTPLTLVETLKENFNISTFEFNDYFQNLQAIRNICILVGKGSIQSIIEAWTFKPDAIISSDLKWSEMLTVSQLKIPFLKVSHSIENVFSTGLQLKMEEKFPSILFCVLKTSSKFSQY